jgi:TetR/AcrR family transcriptional repressor of nem operon
MFDSTDPQLPTKDRLAAVAAELMFRQSFGAVSVDDICKAAGVQKGTFYHHFTSKVELTVAAYDYVWTLMRRDFDPCFSATLPPLVRLEKYAELKYNFHKQLFDKEGKIYGCSFASGGHEMAAQDERIRLKSKEIFDLHCAYFESTLRDMPAYMDQPREKAHDVACEMFSYACGVLYQAKVNNDPAVIKRDLLPGLKRLAGEAN